MNAQELMLVWSESAALSLTVWMVIVVLMGYLGRDPAHRVMLSTSRVLYTSLRLGARSLKRMEERLTIRNKEVMINIGKMNMERAIEREFQRVNSIVERDLSGYPVLHRKINASIKRIGDDYRDASDSPDMPPSWLAAVETISNIPRDGDATMSQILDNIQSTIETAHKQTLKAYTKASQERNGILKSMQPSWQKLDQTLNQVHSSVGGLGERTALLDEHMKAYEALRNGEDSAVRVLTSSSLTQFFIAGLVLVIAMLGGVINFQLIALPMSEMVGGTSQLGPLRTADVAALVIIMVEVVMGLFLLESLRITHMFPVIGTMDDAMRKRMVVITFSILFILASVEASLAYMRDLLAMDREAISHSLSGIGVVEAQFRWIPSIGQMIMGFILPFALAFVAIPLESFIHSLRTVLGCLLSALLRVLAFMLRVTGNVFLQLGKVCIALYDMVIMLPLSVERFIVHQKKEKAPDKKRDKCDDSADVVFDDVQTFGFDEKEGVK